MKCSKFILAALLGLCATTGLAVAKSWERDLYSEGFDYIKVVDQDEWDVPNNHPFPITERELRDILSSVRYERSGFLGLGGSEAPVFNSEQLNLLSKQVLRGLQIARDREDVVFALFGEKDDLIGSKFLVTSGRIFIRDGKLNIIFGKVDHDYQVDLDREDHMQYVWRLQRGERGLRSGELSTEYVDLNPVEPGFRKEVGDLEGAKVMAPLGKAYGKREDWLVFDLAPRTEQDFAMLRAQVETATDLDSVAARHEKKTRELRAGEDPLRNRQASTQPAAAAATPPAMDIEARLAKLKKLKDQGLIDNATYQQKMQEIVGDL